MDPNSPPEKLAQRLEKAEAILHVLERREADAVLSKAGPVLMRPRELVEQERQARLHLEKLVSERTLELVRAKDAADTERNYHSVVSALREGVVLQARDAGIVAWNPAAENLLGLSGAQLKGLTNLDPDWKTIHEDGTPFPLEAHPGSEVMATGIPQTNVVMGIQKPGGALTWIIINAVPIVDSDSTKPSAVVVSFTDITERKKAEATLALHSNILGSLAEGILLVRASDGAVVFANPQMEQLMGYGSNELLGKPVSVINAPDGRDPDAIAEGIKAELERTGVWKGEVKNLRRDGNTIWCQADVTTFEHPEFGRVWVAVHENITKRKEMEEQLQQLAYYDTLTNLPNRRLFNDRLEQTMSSTKRSGRYAALMFLDLDHFKQLNDAHGHEVGDLLLMEVAVRLKACVRATDTVGRIGGDEFVVLIGELNSSKDASTTQARTLAEKIAADLSLPYRLTVQHCGQADLVVEHRCSVSIGLALFIDNEAPKDDIVNWADLAMYRAKEAGRNAIRIHGQVN